MPKHSVIFRNAGLQKFWKHQGEGGILHNTSCLVTGWSRWSLLNWQVWLKFMRETKVSQLVSIERTTALPSTVVEVTKLLPIGTWLIYVP